ncbi:hypothetical protein M2302_003878 [Micromonospora sp. A200]|uniref:hypothetical protein n=1 Tax=Micromonospora sp. A200 TaxID=2940568 RepID=UPI0024731B83|nr:hypothetical protein [Micromonospora sp. A200]MDH6463683.1 hypothetical protein [Micromonospora sp. A200]
MAVTQDDLERALRETFSRRVAVPPPLAADPAGLAIGRARRIRYRRTLTGLSLAAVATAAVTAGMAQLGGHPGRSTTPTVVLGDPRGGATAAAWPVAPAPPAPRAGGDVELIVGGALVTAEGKRYDLGIGPVERAQRLPEHGGWLVVGAPTPAGRTLWVVPSGDAPQVLLAGAEAVVPSPDGRQVAWRDGDGLFAAGLVANRLLATAGTTAAHGATPVRFVGDRVLVRTRTGGHLLWRPAAGPLPDGDRRVLDVYGALPDGRPVGRVPADGNPGRSCLAVLDPADLAPTATGCAAPLTGDGLGAVSPDGRWLLVNGRTGGTDGALLVDLTGPEPGHAARAAGPTISGEVAWNGATMAAYVDRGGALARVDPDKVLAGGRASTTMLSGVTSGERPVVVSGAS